MEFKLLVAFILLMPLSLIFLPNNLFADVVVVDWVTYDKPDDRDACEFVQDKEHGLAYDHCFFDESATEEGRYVAYSTTPETREKRENFRILGGGDDTKVTIPNQEIPLEKTQEIDNTRENNKVQVRYYTPGFAGTRNYKYFHSTITNGDVCTQINALPQFQDCQYRYYNPTTGHFVEANYIQNSQ